MFSLQFQFRVKLCWIQKQGIVWWEPALGGPGGGVGPAENMAEDGVGAGGNQDEAGAEGDAETLDDGEEMNTDGDDVHFGFVT